MAASRAHGFVWEPNWLVMCSVADDGLGFDDTGGLRKQRPGLGLTEMKERVKALGGVLNVKRNGEQGTDLRFEIPLDI